MVTDMKDIYDLIVVGGGAAGFFAAINYSERCPQAKVLIVEAGQRPLTKVKISGGGRCNVTHHCFDPKALTAYYPRGARELRSVFARFQPQSTIDWFAKRGLVLQVESDGRMFPETNRSQSVLDLFYQRISDLNIELSKGDRVIRASCCQQGEFEVSLKSGQDLRTRHLLLATGSHPAGHDLARAFGHNIVDPVPSLFTFNISSPILAGMAGQSFEYVQLELVIEQGEKGRRCRYRQAGPMLITHWGLSGPAVLKLSAFAARDLFASSYKATLKVNLQAQQSAEELRQELASWRQNHASKPLAHIQMPGFSKRFWHHFLQCLAIDPKKYGANLTRTEENLLLESLCRLALKVDGKGVFKEEFVTAGGVERRGIDFRTMESKVQKNLFMAGELLDIDGVTGGFNFQNAWSGAWIAAQSMACSEVDR